MLKDVEDYKLHDEEYQKKIHAHKVLENYIYYVKAKIKIHKEDMKKNLENALNNTSKYLDVSKLADVDT